MSVLTTAVEFVAVLTVLVFVHELGHYLVARWCGVRIETFSIGFGPELFGWYDRAGTRWKFSAVPLGGYVKMFGDADPSSQPGAHLADMSADDRAVSFHHKRLPQRAAVVAAGPAANFAFAILLLAGLYATIGQPITPAVVGQVLTDSAAEAAGLQPGDAIVAIDGNHISRFEDIQQAVMLDLGSPLQLKVHRGDQDLTLTVTPRVVDDVDHFGYHHPKGQLGISRTPGERVRLNPPTAVAHATSDAWIMTGSMLKGVWQMVIGERSAGELSGVVGIARYTGEAAKDGLAGVLLLMVGLSLNLGLINLFPIPVLDGGHLVFYAAEALRGRPLGQRAQEYGFRVGLALIISLMVFANGNDIAKIVAKMFNL